MPLWLRAIEFAVYWALFAGVAWWMCALAARASRSSTGKGIAARVFGSLVLGAAGYFVGVAHILTLGVLVAGDYRALLPSLGWCIWVAIAAGAAIPWSHLWLTSGRGRKP